MPAIVPIPNLGSFGVRANLEIRQGADFASPQCNVVANGGPFDLTGVTITGYLAKRPGLDVSQQTAFTITMGSPLSAGVFSFSMSKTLTAALTAGTSPFDPSSRYVYKVDMVNGAGIITPLLYGDVVVLRNV